MSLFYRAQYLIGLTPWERLPTVPAAEQAYALLEREEAQREPPYGRALDLGCGSGIWSVKLAQRGWDVVGIDVVPKAVRAARKRARREGVDVRFVEGSITELRPAETGTGFGLVLDFGVVHGLGPEQRRAVGREVDAVATEDATVLMYAVSPGRRGPLPRGVSRADIEDAYRGWQIEHAEPMDVSGMPRLMQDARPHWYRLRRA